MVYCISYWLLEYNKKILKKTKNPASLRNRIFSIGMNLVDFSDTLLTYSFGKKADFVDPKIEIGMHGEHNFLFARCLFTDLAIEM